MRSIWILPLLMLAGLRPALADDPVSAAETRAQQQLDAAMAELSTLRESIEAEKLPLARKLSELDDQLVELRRRQDSTLRQIDQGSFDDAKLDVAVKQRQDETGYVASLLDEYARNFETRLAVGETDRFASVVSAAKDSTSDPSLSADARLDRQLELVRASIARLDDVIGGTRFEGSAVDPRGMLATGRFALVGPVVLFAAKDGSSAGVAVAQAGSNRPTVRPVDEGTTAAVSTIVASGAGLLPLDPSRGGALEQLVRRTNIIHIFKKGGPIMWPLLFVSILATATVLERLVFLARVRGKSDRKALFEFLAAVEHGRFDEAIAIGQRTRDFVVQSLAYALAHRDKSLPSALLYSTAQELKRFSRGVPILDTAITIAPLLGLLGTVTGMMSSFSLIGGDLGAPGAITGGIAEALIATAFGLGIAIVSLVPYNFLNNQTEQARHDLEAASAQLELLAKPWLDSADTVAVAPAQRTEAARVSTQTLAAQARAESAA
jgi:biopolymer transport protein ExbB